MICQGAVSIESNLFVSVALICLVDLLEKKIILSKICILYCLVLLNNVIF